MQFRFSFVKLLADVPLLPLNFLYLFFFFFSSDSKNNANCSLLEREETAAAHFPSVPFLLISSLFLALLGSLRRAERCDVNLLCIFWLSNQCEIVLQNVLLQRTLAANLFPGWLYLPADVGYPISL